MTAAVCLSVRRGGVSPAGDASRSSISTVDSEGRVGASMLSQMSKRWSTLETAGRCMFMCTFCRRDWTITRRPVAGRCMFMLSVAFLVIGVVLTVVSV